jgi:hypothetical protein
VLFERDRPGWSKDVLDGELEIGLSVNTQFPQSLVAFFAEVATGLKKKKRRK